MKNTILALIRANRKTTVVGLSYLIVNLAVHFGLDVDEQTRQAIEKIVDWLALAVLALLAADSSKQVAGTQQAKEEQGNVDVEQN